LRTPNGVIAPTGKALRVRMMASFEFAPGSARIVCERPYFDRRAVLTALGLGEAARSAKARLRAVPTILV